MWTVVTYRATTLFSLKISSATSSGGRSLLVPTPYAAKMAFVNAAFRVGLPDTDCEALLRQLRDVDLRIGVPDGALVTHTFVKVRQQNRDVKKNPTEPYKSTIAYRELVHHRGDFAITFPSAAREASMLESLAPAINQFGKRGSFFQYVGARRADAPGAEFAAPVSADKGTRQWPTRAHIVPADDFGPEAELAVLSSYTAVTPKRDKHRKFVQTIVPLGVVNVGPGFTEYARD